MVAAHAAHAASPGCQNLLLDIAALPTTSELGAETQGR
jgi:hypothetical protein